MAVVRMRSPIGLFDSGLGGLTVLRELQRALAGERFIYLGDNARFPYGTKSNETIERYSRECAEFLLTKGVDLVVVACNTASAAALTALEQELAVPVIGTIGPAVRAALATSTNGVIGVLGTNATVANRRARTRSGDQQGVGTVTSDSPAFKPPQSHGSRRASATTPRGPLRRPRPRGKRSPGS